MKHRIAFAILLFMPLAPCTAHSQNNAAQGAVVGGAVGATAGAVIGSQTDQTVQGAIVGGALGALAGAIIADSQDNQVYRPDRRYHRSACREGERYFRDARGTRDHHRQVYYLREGLRYCPNNPAAHNDLGLALLLIGDRSSAIRHFNFALQLDNGYEPARRNLAYLHRQRNRWEDSERNRWDEHERNRWDDRGRDRGDDRHDRGRHHGD